MNKIVNPVNVEQLPNRELLFKFFEKVGELGDIIIYKMDGVRKSNKYTVFISSGNMTFETIRCDAPSLMEAVVQTLEEYKKVRKDFNKF